MPYLIDGHNLIPKVGLRLDSPDDELELVGILREFARLKRQQVEVYFDGAPIGHAGTQRLGSIRAHFVKLGQTADDAIRLRLNKMGGEAKNWTVVSSDREVQSAARVSQAKYISSAEFVKILRITSTATPTAEPLSKKLTSAEVDEWLKLFRDNEN